MTGPGSITGSSIYSRDEDGNQNKDYIPPIWPSPPSVLEVPPKPSPNPAMPNQQRATTIRWKGASIMIIKHRGLLSELIETYDLPATLEGLKPPVQGTDYLFSAKPEFFDGQIEMIRMSLEQSTNLQVYIEILMDKKFNEIEARFMYGNSRCFLIKLVEKYDAIKPDYEASLRRYPNLVDARRAFMGLNGIIAHERISAPSWKRHAMPIIIHELPFTFTRTPSPSFASSEGGGSDRGKGSRSTASSGRGYRQGATYLHPNSTETSIPGPSRSASNSSLNSQVYKPAGIAPGPSRSASSTSLHSQINKPAGLAPGLSRSSSSSSLRSHVSTPVEMDNEFQEVVLSSPTTMPPYVSHVSKDSEGGSGSGDETIHVYIDEQGKGRLAPPASIPSTPTPSVPSTPTTSRLQSPPSEYSRFKVIYPDLVTPPKGQPTSNVGAVRAMRASRRASELDLAKRNQAAASNAATRIPHPIPTLTVEPASPSPQSSKKFPGSSNYDFTAGMKSLSLQESSPPLKPGLLYPGRAVPTSQGSNPLTRPRSPENSPRSAEKREPKRQRFDCVHRHPKQMSRISENLSEDDYDSSNEDTQPSQAITSSSNVAPPIMAPLNQPASRIPRPPTRSPSTHLPVPVGTKNARAGEPKNTAETYKAQKQAIAKQATATSSATTSRRTAPVGNGATIGNTGGNDYINLVNSQRNAPLVGASRPSKNPSAPSGRKSPRFFMQMPWKRKKPTGDNYIFGSTNWKNF